MCAGKSQQKAERLLKLHNVLDQKGLYVFVQATPLKTNSYALSVDYSRFKCYYATPIVFFVSHYRQLNWCFLDFLSTHNICVCPQTTNKSDCFTWFGIKCLSPLVYCVFKIHRWGTKIKKHLQCLSNSLAKPLKFTYGMEQLSIKRNPPILCPDGSGQLVLNVVTVRTIAYD